MECIQTAKRPGTYKSGFRTTPKSGLAASSSSNDDTSSPAGRLIPTSARRAMVREARTKSAVIIRGDAYFRTVEARSGRRSFNASNGCDFLAARSFALLNAFFRALCDIGSVAVSLVIDEAPQAVSLGPSSRDATVSRRRETSSRTVSVEDDVAVLEDRSTGVGGAVVNGDIWGEGPTDGSGDASSS